MEQIAIVFDKDRIERILQYVEKKMNEEEQNKKYQQKMGGELAAAYANNYKKYKEDLAIWESLPLVKRLITKKPRYS